MIWFVVVVFLTVFISANCSLYEAVLYSAQPGALEAMKAGSKKTGLISRMMSMKKNISAPIAAILILNTIANTAGATVCGMLATKELGEKWVVPFSICLTLAILLFAEIIPKTMGAVHWRRFWKVTVWPLVAMRWALAPIIWLTEKLTRLLTGGEQAPAVTEEDILGVAKLGASEGQISEVEGRMVVNVIKLEEHQVHEVMTPRTVMFAMDGTLTVQEAYDLAEEKQFSRVPVFRDDREKIVGYVTRYELGSAEALKTPEDGIEKMVRPVTFIPKTTNCLKVLLSFLKSRQHMAVVCDEFGGVSGIVTLEDIIETLLGAEIIDETDLVPDLREQARKQAKDKV